MKKKLIIAVLLVGVLSFVGVYYFVFYRPTHHVRDIASEDAIVVSAKDIVKEFQTNETASNTKYLNKVAEISGEVVEAKKDQTGKPTVTLKSDDSFSNVFVTLRGDKQLEVKGGATITIRGVVTGFLSDVVINDGIVVKQ